MLSVCHALVCHALVLDCALHCRSKSLVPTSDADREEVDTSGVEGKARLVLPSHATDSSDKSGTKENNLIDLS